MKQGVGIERSNNYLKDAQIVEGLEEGFPARRL